MINHVSLGFSKRADSPFGDFAVGVHDGLAANATIFTTLPVTLAALATATSGFQSKLALSFKGSEAQTAAKDAARLVVDGMLRQLAAYVENVAQGDEIKIRAAGFEVAAHGHAAQTPLVKPGIKAILNNMTTQLKVNVTTVPNANAFEVQMRTGAGAWQAAGTFANSRSIVLAGLTPGTLYELRVRAIGGSTGFSDWSDPVSHMAM